MTNRVTITVEWRQAAETLDYDAVCSTVAMALLDAGFVAEGDNVRYSVTIDDVSAPRSELSAPAPPAPPIEPTERHSHGHSVEVRGDQTETST